MTVPVEQARGLTSDKLRATQDAVGGLLTEVAMYFKGRPKITLLVRHPDLEAVGKDADFIMTDDDLEHAITALQRRCARLAALEATPARSTGEQTPADREAVAKALLPYTSHNIGCAIYQRSWVSGEPPCTCGLDEARALLSAPSQ